MPKNGHKRNPKKACPVIAASLVVISKLSAAKQRNLRIIYEFPLEENIFFFRHAPLFHSDKAVINALPRRTDEWRLRSNNNSVPDCD